MLGTDSFCLITVHTAHNNCVDFSKPFRLLMIGEVPFPAVTICPLTKFSTKKFNFTDVYRAMLKLDGNQSRTITDDE